MPATRREPEAVLSNLRFGLRLGNDPKLAVTTTPRPIPALRKLMAESGTVTERAETALNAHNLSPGFLAHLNDVYGGTRLAVVPVRAEFDGDRIARLERVPEEQPLRRRIDGGALHRRRQPGVPDLDAPVGLVDVAEGRHAHGEAACDDGERVHPSGVALAEPPVVVVLTTYETEADVIAAMQAGASGYLLKGAASAIDAAGIGCARRV
mgnify:CR=1 FL=1